MSALLRVKRVRNRGDLKKFVMFPWRVYQDDPNWVPPLISDQLNYLDPKRGHFYRHAQVALFTAVRGGELQGTIAAFVDRPRVEYSGTRIGGFGFFEVLEQYPVAEALLDAACEWLRSQGMRAVDGPTNFTDLERPGVLLEGADCPPVMMQAHTPLYYHEYLTRYGFEKDHDLYAWRAHRSQIGEELQNIPPDLNRVAEMAKKTANVDIRTLDMDRWDEEINAARHIFNATLNHLPEFSPISETEFHHIADPMRLFLDPDLALIAEVEGQAIGFIVALPDINRALIHINGRLFPFGWLKLKRLIPEIDVASFKLMGIMDHYRRRGIDALLYLEAVKAVYHKGYQWIEGSVTSEQNPMVNLIAQRLGAERYKHFRVLVKEL
jgi:GNAT superfamily N-acetyltransferase